MSGKCIKRQKASGEGGRVLNNNEEEDSTKTLALDACIDRAWRV